MLLSWICINHMCSQVPIDNGKCTPPDNIKSAITQLHLAEEGISKYSILKIELESSKLSHSRGDNKAAIDLLTSSVVGYVSCDPPMLPRPGTQAAQCKELCSRSLLTLVKWLQVLLYVPEIHDPQHDKTNKLTCALSEDSDQPGHPPSLIRVFPLRSVCS